MRVAKGRGEAAVMKARRLLVDEHRWQYEAGAEQEQVGQGAYAPDSLEHRDLEERELAGGHLQAAEQRGCGCMCVCACV